MGALAALIDVKGENVVPLALELLEAMQRRASHAYGIATPETAATSVSFESLKEEPLSSSSAVGYNLLKTQKRDIPQPLLGYELALAFEGRIYPAPEKAEVEFILDEVGSDLIGWAEKFVEDVNGSYSFAMVREDMIVVGRDAVGVRPLYVGERDTIRGVASDWKALQRIGLRNIRQFPPGSIAVLDREEVSIRPVKVITQPPVSPIEKDEAVKQLIEFLLRSVEDRTSDLEEVAIAFSGGLDSSVLAKLCEIADKKPHLLSVTLKGEEQAPLVKDVAERLGFPLTQKVFSEEDVEECLKRILPVLEEPNPLNISIAIPVSWVAELALEEGYTCLLAGQGCDEIFGGYHRYTEVYGKLGLAAVREQIFRDTAFAYRNNYNRDERVCAEVGVELRLPYADYELINYALQLPLSLKIESADDPLRKRILREVARAIGLPESIVGKHKKAIQYETGVDRTLRRLARREKLELPNYLRGYLQP